MKPETLLLPTTSAGFDRAAELLRDGGLVAFPTETVYGLGADAVHDQGVARIFEAKGRPEFNPLIVHVSSIEMAQTYVHWSDDADRLAQAFWPGPLTLVLPMSGHQKLSSLVSGGLSSLAIRMPDHDVARSLLDAVGRPLAAPSANPSGRISPTTPDHVLAGLSGKIDAVLDGGSCDVGLESTIIGLTSGEPTLLRPGGLPSEIIEQALGQPLVRHTSHDLISAPGQLASHYAPSASVRLNARAPQDGEVFLGFGPIESDLNLSYSGDLIEAAANLFAHLHRLDKIGVPIAVAPVPDHGLGRAINDRLRRAAAPRIE